MRATGHTTRLIDKAVQMLFTLGEIWVFNQGTLDHMGEALIGMSPRQMEIVWQLRDIDSSPGNLAQHNFIEGLVRRLRVEHDRWIRIEATNYGIHVRFLSTDLDKARKMSEEEQYLSLVKEHYTAQDFIKPPKKT